MLSISIGGRMVAPQAMRESGLSLLSASARTGRGSSATGFMLPALVIVAGVGSLTLTGHVGGAGVPAYVLPSTPPGDGIVPRKVAKAYSLEGANTAPYPSAAAFKPKFRFGFLEFEDAPE